MTATTTTDFTGFSQDTIAFLADLRADNDRSWFEANRDRYQDHWMAPARAFVEAAGEALAQLDPGITAEPKVNGSILRINRDTRFSTDKTPYKDHLDVWLWHGPQRRGAVSGFRLRLTPDGVGIGAGTHGFDDTQLARYRRAVVDPDAGPQLAEAIRRVESAGFEVGAERWKRTPAGLTEPDDPILQRAVRFDRCFSGAHVDHPGTLGQKRFVSWCVTRWRRQLPLHQWLVEHVG